VLHILCKNYGKGNLIDIIRFLIQNGIDVNSTNEDGWNVLHMLCKNYKKKKVADIIHLLIQNGIKENSATTNGMHCGFCAEAIKMAI
jgi:ankyrin repeat protein